MRIITVRNHSFKPAKILATVVLNNSGQIAIEGPMREQLMNGVFHQKTRELVSVSDGEIFMDALLWEFKGAYVRASEAK